MCKSKQVVFSCHWIQPNSKVLVSMLLGLKIVSILSRLRRMTQIREVFCYIWSSNSERSGLKRQCLRWMKQLLLRKQGIQSSVSDTKSKKPKLPTKPPLRTEWSFSRMRCFIWLHASFWNVMARSVKLLSRKFDLDSRSIQEKLAGPYFE